MTRALLPQFLLVACTLQPILTSGQSVDCRSLAESGDCAFYTDCVERRIPCGNSGYALAYGYHFCNAFGEHSDSFNIEGQHWITNVRSCLTTAVYLSAEYQNNGTCEQLRELAFNSHPDCYVNNGFCSDIANLRDTTNLQGLIKVLWTRFSAIFTRLSLKQVLDTVIRCISERFDDALDFLHSAIASTVEELFRGFLQDILAILQSGCTRDFQIMFLLDSSGSINRGDYETMKGFVANVILSLNATEESQIGVINFSGSPELVIPLTSARNLNNLVNQVQAIAYIGGGTQTDTALDLMVETVRLASDSDAIPIGILLTDGQSNSPPLTLAAAARVHAAGVSMYTFGIGNTNPEELQAIASTPNNDYSFYISTFSAADFQQHVFSLTRQACSTPEVGELEESSSHTLSEGEMSYITYPFEPEGVTLQLRVEEGTVDVFGSFNVRNPTQSTADFSFTAELQTTYYVSPETFENATGMQLNGRSARQVVSENATTEHSLFISISGINEMNSFVVTTVEGDDPGTFAFIRGNLRLQHGATANQGRVEIFMDGDWQTICDDSWDIVDADIVCRQLGLGYAVAAPTGNYFPFATANIWKVDVNCTGTERKLVDCHAPSTLPNTDCFHHEDAGTVCSGEALHEGAVRLGTGGNSISNGFLEMYYDSQWGRICSDGWDIVDTAVACSQLGFIDMSSINFTVSANNTAGSQPIHSSNVQCSGAEPSIFTCSQDPIGNNSCDHSSVIMVMCGTSSALGATRAAFSAILVAILAAILC